MSKRTMCGAFGAVPLILTMLAAPALPAGVQAGDQSSKSHWLKGKRLLGGNERLSAWLSPSGDRSFILQSQGPRNSD